MLLAWALLQTIEAFDLGVAFVANCLAIAASYAQLFLITEFILTLDGGEVPWRKSCFLVGAVALSYTVFMVRTRTPHMIYGGLD